MVENYLFIIIFAMVIVFGVATMLFWVVQTLERCQSSSHGHFLHFILGYPIPNPNFSPNPLTLILTLTLNPNPKP